jgi:hypothetical protein
VVAAIPFTPCKSQIIGTAGLGRGGSVAEPRGPDCDFSPASDILSPNVLYAHPVRTLRVVRTVCPGVVGNSANGNSRGVVVMSRTLSWSPSVGQVWTLRDGSGHVEVVADHVHARLVLVRSPGGDESWLGYDALHEECVQACCESCGKPLDGMSWLLLQESRRSGGDDG